MAIDFSDKRVTMVVCPVDGRYGFYALSDLAFKLLHIDIYKQEDYVVFVSRSRGICKIICTDECGTTLITRRLHKGRFERLLMQAQGPAAISITPQMLADFINGKPLFVKRESLWQGQLNEQKSAFVTALHWLAAEAFIGRCKTAYFP